MRIAWLQKLNTVRRQQNLFPALLFWLVCGGFTAGWRL